MMSGLTEGLEHENVDSDNVKRVVSLEYELWRKRLIGNLFFKR